jgi:hypothetical protein
MAAVVVLAAWSDVARAGLTCGRTVVLPGASKGEVLAKCGEPSGRRSLSSGGKASKRRGGAGGGGREVWIYDLGSRQLVRYLTFDRGRLVSIEFGGYGG